VQFSLGVVFGTVFVEPELLLLRVVVLCDPNAFLQIVALLEAELKGSIIFTTASTCRGACSVHFGDKAHGSTAFFLVSDLFAVLLRISGVGYTTPLESRVVDAGRQCLG
jgi:hypothetical protein